MLLEKMINEAKKRQKIETDHPVVEVQANVLAMFFPQIKIKKAFFQAANPNGVDEWRLYFVTDKDEAFVLPVNPLTPIHLLMKRGLVDDLKEFQELTVLQKKEFSKQLDKKESDYGDLLDEIAPKKKEKKKRKLKSVK